jgi:hypothetical protein
MESAKAVISVSVARVCNFGNHLTSHLGWSRVMQYNLLVLTSSEIDKEMGLSLLNYSADSTVSFHT